MAQMKSLTINGTKFTVVTPVPVTSVTLLASKWLGDSSPYSQVVAIPNVTPYTKVDLQPTEEQLAIFHQKDIAFTTRNDDGVVTAFVIGDKPQNDYTIQATVVEVTV